MLDIATVIQHINDNTSHRTVIQQRRGHYRRPRSPSGIAGVSTGMLAARIMGYTVSQRRTHHDTGTAKAEMNYGDLR